MQSDHSARRLAPLSIALSLVLPACGSSPMSTGDAGGSSADFSMASQPDLADAATSGAGPSTVMGSVGGKTFNKAMTTLWFGDALTTVVYMFDAAIACSDIGAMGWDTQIPNGTQILELKMWGSTPQTYKVTTRATPGPGEAATNYTLSSTMGTPVETGTRTGTVTIDTISPTTVSGAFQLNFINNDKLSGTYNAVLCPGGSEP